MEKGNGVASKQLTDWGWRYCLGCAWQEHCESTLQVAGAWSHVMNRGHRAGTLFLNDADRRRFLGAAAELSERFGLELPAFVLMHNH